MKRRKILVLIPMLGLFLTGCTFQEGFATAKHWVGQNIYHPAKDFIEGLIGKKDNKEEEQKPSEDGGKQDGGDQTEVKYTVKFQAGGGSGTMADVADVKGEYVLPACTFTAPEGKEFAGWKVGDEVKAAGEKITVSADVTLVATWKDKGEEEVTSIEDVYAAAVAAGDTPTTQAYTFQGVVTGTQGNSFYLQENGHGMLVYNYPIEGIALGKIVKVTATVKTYKGLPETDTTSAGEIVGDGELPTPLSISSLAGIGDANVLASVAEATFKSKDAAWASDKASLAVFVIGEDEVTVKFDKFGYDAEKAALLNAATDGQKFVLNKVLTSVNGEAKQLGFAGTSEISLWTDPGEIDHFGTVTGLPETVEVGGTISNSSVDVEVFYVGGEKGTVHPSDIQFDNSQEAENVSVTLKYGELTIPGTYTVNVVPSTETITPLADVYAAGVAAGTGESTEVYTYQGIVTGKQGTSYYIQDGAHGMYIYNSNVISPAVGDLVKIKSTVSSYNKSPQSKTVSEAKIISSGNPLPTPISVTGLSSIGDAHLLASVSTAVFVSKDAAWASNKASLAVFTIGSDSITVKFDKFGYDETKASVLNNAVAGEAFALGNILTAVNGTTKQLGFAGTSTIEKLAVTPETIEITSASSVGVGQSLTLAATVGPSGAPQDVSWDIVSGGEYATLVNGVLTGTAAGDVVVKATATGYSGVVDTMTINVSSAVVPTEQAIYTLDGTVTGGSTGYADASDIEQGGVHWDVVGNTTMSPWRIGGKNLTEVDRTVTCKSAFNDDVTKVVVSTGSKTLSAVNSITLLVGTAEGASDVDSIQLTSDLVSASLEYARPEGHSWANCYFTVVFNVNAGGSNSYIQLNSITLYALK